jgi:diadenosine tetraphosphatase ApaH/serine/threonine PP2A family protein phosphatase
LKLAVISDIHGNREALEAVLEEAARRHADGYICLGDIVGYGADPGPCVERIRELPATVVLGNHDAAACGRADIQNFNDYARAALLWTKDRLDREARDYLASLPLTRRVGNVTLVHSSLDSPDYWGYIISREEAWRCFDHLDGPCCLIGHSHIPYHFRLGADDLAGGPWRRLALENGLLYIINPGSVGQPRDGDTRASFALADLEEKTFELIRVPYDIAACQEKIIAAGLPKYLASRLGAGR